MRRVLVSYRPCRWKPFAALPSRPKAPPPPGDSQTSHARPWPPRASSDTDSRSTHTAQDLRQRGGPARRPLDAGRPVGRRPDQGEVRLRPGQVDAPGSPPFPHLSPLIRRTTLKAAKSHRRRSVPSFPSLPSSLESVPRVLEYLSGRNPMMYSLSSIYVCAIQQRDRESRKSSARTSARRCRDPLRLSLTVSRCHLVRFACCALLRALRLYLCRSDSLDHARPRRNRFIAPAHHDPPRGGQAPTHRLCGLQKGRRTA